MEDQEDQEVLAIPKAYRGKRGETLHGFENLYREGDLLVFKDKSPQENHKICDSAYKYARRHGFYVAAKRIGNKQYIIRLDPLRHERKAGDSIVKYRKRDYEWKK